MIEIIAGANGWIVRPARYHNDGMIEQESVFVFNDAKDLGKHVAEWGEEQLTAKKPCTCKR